jgi:hypothetical protein
MMKKRVIAAGIGLLLVFGSLVAPAKADAPPSVAIIDTGVNSSLFTSNIVA